MLQKASLPIWHIRAGGSKLVLSHPPDDFPNPIGLENRLIEGERGSFPFSHFPHYSISLNFSPIFPGAAVCETAPSLLRPCSLPSIRCKKQVALPMNRATLENPITQDNLPAPAIYLFLSGNGSVPYRLLLVSLLLAAREKCLKAAILQN